MIIQNPSQVITIQKESEGGKIAQVVQVLTRTHVAFSALQLRRSRFAEQLVVSLFLFCSRRKRNVEGRMTASAGPRHIVRDIRVVLSRRNYRSLNPTLPGGGIHANQAAPQAAGRTARR